MMTGFFFLLLSGCTGTPRPIMHQPACKRGVYAIKSAQCLSQKQLAAKLEPYQVIFVGDHHTSEKPHRFMADLILELGKRGYTLHLANEWFVPDDALVLQRYMTKGYDGNFTEEINWTKKAGYDFMQYEPIYKEIRNNGGTMHGINLTKEFRRKISDRNLTGMSDDERHFFDSLDLNVSAHRQLLEPFFSHCHGSKKGENDTVCKERMYRVQVAWDTMMAQESAKLAERVLKSPKDKLLVFAGAMHLSDSLGANMRFARLSKLPYVTVLPEIYSKQGYSNCAADYLFLYSLTDHENK